MPQRAGLADQPIREQGVLALRVLRLLRLPLPARALMAELAPRRPLGPQPLALHPVPQRQQLQMQCHQGGGGWAGLAEVVGGCWRLQTAPQ